jgi:hypothetical protein
MLHIASTPKSWLCKKQLKHHVFGIANKAKNTILLYPHFEHWW